MNKTLRDFFIGMYAIGMAFTYGFLLNLQSSEDPAPFIVHMGLTVAWPFVLGSVVGMLTKELQGITLLGS